MSALDGFGGLEPEGWEPPDSLTAEQMLRLTAGEAGAAVAPMDERPSAAPLDKKEAARERLVEVLLQQARVGDAAVAEVAALRCQLENERLRHAAELARADRRSNERRRLSLDATLNGLIAGELDAGNDERAAALRCLRAWNRGAGYVIQRRAT